ncbi:MAG: hypothetical protein Q9P14_08235 [candidate division KSB1 bacterium]|nr:hypothetical protein [candidate division KSB1 bacterium]MDQ7066048.1 hypothetical protein [candidate division KSB1 bacterium]
MMRMNFSGHMRMGVWLGSFNVQQECPFPAEPVKSNRNQHITKLKKNQAKKSPEHCGRMGVIQSANYRGHAANHAGFSHLLQPYRALSAGTAYEKRAAVVGVFYWILFYFIIYLLPDYVNRMHDRLVSASAFAGRRDGLSEWLPIPEACSPKRGMHDRLLEKLK